VDGVQASLPTVHQQQQEKTEVLMGRLLAAGLLAVGRVEAEQVACVGVGAGAGVGVGADEWVCVWVSR